MKLSEIIKLHEDGDQITVFDEIYDTEVYFFNKEDSDWDKAAMKLASYLDVKKMSEYGITVNLTELIEANMENFKKYDLFKEYDIDIIMEEIDLILSGYVSEGWFVNFANAITKEVE